MNVDIFAPNLVKSRYYERVVETNVFATDCTAFIRTSFPVNVTEGLLM